MRKTIKYGNIERVTYEVDKYEVSEAVLRWLGVWPVMSGAKSEFDIDDDGNATLTLVYEKEARP